MKKFLVLVLLIGLLIVIGIIVVGCTNADLPTGYNNVPPITVTITATPTTTPTISDNITQTQSQPLPVPTPEVKVIDMNNTTFIYPSKLVIDQIGIGNNKDFKIQIHNGDDTDKEFSVYYQQPTQESNLQPSGNKDPDLLKGIYQPAPDDAINWIKFLPSITVQSKWTENILINLSIPDNVITPNKWYFYIVTKDTTQGNVGAANASTIFVNMIQ